MKRLALFALTAATVIAASGSALSIQAGAKNSACEKLQKDNCIVIGGNLCNKNNLDDILSQIEKELGDCKWNYCVPEIIFPCIGTTTPTPTPENNQPETEEAIPTAIPTARPTAAPTVIPTAAPTVAPEDTTEATFAEQVVKLVNKERAKAGLKELTLDKTIESAALIRAKEIVQSFSHTRPNGSNFSTVLKEQGITYRGAGENIAWGQKSPEEVMKAWMNSDGHRANILNPNFTKIGVGHYQNAKGTNYWAQLFTY